MHFHTKKKKIFFCFLNHSNMLERDCIGLRLLGKRDLGVCVCVCVRARVCVCARERVCVYSQGLDRLSSIYPSFVTINIYKPLRTCGMKHINKQWSRAGPTTKQTHTHACTHTHTHTRTHTHTHTQI